MKKTLKSLFLLGMSFSLLSGICLVAFPKTADAKGPQPIEGVSYNVDVTVIDNLKLLYGKKVTVYLDNGTALTGSVKKVGRQSLHLEKLDGKDFFDALISIKNIIAIDMQFRKY